MKKLILILALLASVAAKSAAVPLKWTVETSRVQPVAFDAVRGETLALEAAFNSYGTPLQLAPTSTSSTSTSTSSYSLFYQTNGMGSAWWTIPATVSSNRVSATFAPTNDPGAPVVIGFLGSTGEIYRAAFTIRFRHGPGATPNMIALPVETLDFSHITVLNPPWDEGKTDGQAVTNIVDGIVTNYLPLDGGTMTGHIAMGNDCEIRFREGGYIASSTICVGGDSLNSSLNWDCLTRTFMDDEGDYQSVFFNFPEKSGTLALLSDLENVAPGDYANVSNKAYAAATPSVVSNIVEGYGYALPSVTNGLVRADITNGLVTAAITNGLASTAYVDAYSAQTLASAESSAASLYYPLAQGEAWSTYWDGDDVRVTVTNYDSSARLPSLYIEQRTNDVALSTNLFRTVWRELAHWQQFLGEDSYYWSTNWPGFASWSESLQDELSTKADRAWGFYDSHTGKYSPDGYTQVSSEHIIIAKDMSYQKKVTTSGEVWVLTADEPYEPTGVASNSCFQIRDGDGNVQFEIVKGDKVTVAAQANAVEVEGATLYVTYNIVADTHPTAEVALALTNASWSAETAADCPATVSWSGTSGAYVAAITPKTTTSSCFVKATYEVGGEGYTRFATPIRVSGVSGKTYDFVSMKGMYEAVRDLVVALGGSVTNYPSFK